MGFIESRCTAAYKTSCQEALVVWFPLTASLHHGRPVLQKKSFWKPLGHDESEMLTYFETQRQQNGNFRSHHRLL